MECVHGRTEADETQRRVRNQKTIQMNVKLLGMEGDPKIKFLLDGGDLLKVRSSNWKKTRYYKLQEDCKTMWQESKKTFKSKQTFSLDEIAAVTLGRQSEGLKKYTEEQVEGRCFSIMFKGRRRNLDLIASSEEEARQWVNSLEKLITHMSNLSPQQKTEHWILACLRKADKNKDEKLSQSELKNFLRLINIEVDDDYAEMIFKKCDKSKSGYLSGQEIEHFYDLLTHREEINVIYGTYAKTAGFMTPENLVEFLMKEQREKATLAEAHRIIENHEPDENVKAKKLLSIDGFIMYMHHPEAMLLNSDHQEVYQDMSQPLNHYFISSSHNTYLMEDQLKGPSSTEAYVRALLKGCRCVELDCWDGSDGEPLIYHGFTLTSRILFKDVIKAIKENAFTTSEYPVIISLENHCSVEQQKVMAHHMNSILGSALITAPLEDKMPTDFPSPEELKGKFLIKGKRLNKLEASYRAEVEAELTDVTEEEESNDEDEEKEKEKSKKKKLKLAKELSDMVIYFKSVHFNGFEDAMKNLSFYEMSSFKEGKAVGFSEESANLFVRHNVHKVSRIYPAGSRTNSSNYNPVPLWNAGCQLVALNFQTPCSEMDVNQGRFLINGKSGYVLKPAFMRDIATEFDPITLTRGDWLKHKMLHVMIISAQQLPKLNKKKSSIVDPMVTVEIYGVPADVAKKETHTVENNGFNPSWNESFQFDVYVPDLALVRFMVEDHDSTSDNEFIGQYTLPFNSLKMGYRHVPLLNKNGDRLPSAGLFVHIMVVDAK
ncbi:1-phosphatidylinositol 4,5-bisphosphate phosphodiesterase delta-1-like isoform X1 [Solea senegalensis]|uniref:phosphoinositide phospholipase C n=2 Tax=Solea senegalensis TaxID=28829 RepID=A0AAV6T4N7_SOLSE|nr:1-phosphatidylinositol 4,5-bisphosphate phosphodiesterase delta-1-like isoform X1 [Solea senegalensis]KAG7524498.1 1-phosphatidylinositol 4,5-bisphosphate phosphodiesterase delta-1-like isoform X1 [Solea senegalensis]